MTRAKQASPLTLPGRYRTLTMETRQVVEPPKTVVSVTLENGVTLRVTGRVQKAISLLVHFSDFLNHPLLRGKFSLNLAGPDAQPSFEVEQS